VSGFDPRAYEDEVLKPLRRHLPHLPDDLLNRYAVDVTMDASALRERIDTVVRLWNKQAMRAGPLGLVSQQLIREHEELLASHDPATPEFWRAWRAERSRKLGSAIDEVASLLRESHGALGVITRNQLRAAAAAHGAVGDAELYQATRKAELTVVEPVELPTAAGMRGQLKGLTNALLAAGVGSIPELLFPELTSFGLLGGLTVTPTPAGRRVSLTHEAATARMLELDKMPDTTKIRAERGAVGILVTEGKAGVDLTSLALFHLLQVVREKHAEGAPARTLFSLLTRSKLQPADAGRIIVSLLAEGGTRRDPAAAVAELLAEGRLVAAQQSAAALPGADGDAARAAVTRQREQVENLRTGAAEDLRAGRDEQAGARLREAMSLAADLPGLAEELATVPAAPVLGVSASADGGGVRVAWRPAPDHGQATVFRVVRGNGRDPVDPDDGTEIPVKAGHATADAAPPVGRRVHYAVFARVASGRWSRPACAAVQVVPPVTDVVIEGGNRVVTGRWRVHPDVATVEVRRTTETPDGAGEPVAVERNRAFRDESVVDGVQYYYTLVASYLPASGGTAMRSALVVERGATRLEAKPVTSLTVTAAGGGSPTVRLSWQQRPGSEIVIRRSHQPCPWEYGEFVAPVELQTYGTEFDGQLSRKGESMTLVASVPPGRSWFVPFTTGPQGGLRGQDASIDLFDPVRRVRAQRFGDDIRVTWLWPDEVSAAEVAWTGGRRRITLQQYREEGGCELRSVPGVTRVEVSAVVLGSGDEVRSPAISVEVDDRPPQLSYQLRRRGHRLAGGVKCTVTLSGAEAVRGATLILVGSSGAVMPLSADAGIELLRESVVVEAGVPVVLPEVPVPGVLRKPYWLRCFLAEPAPALLVDPPVGQLKVS